MNKELLDVFEKQRDALFGFVCKRCNDEALAQDIMQDLYMKLQSQPSNKLIEYPKAYVYRIANNLIIDNQRRQNRELPSSNQEFEEQTDPLTPELQLDYQQRLAIVTEAINELPLKTREVFKLQRIEQRDKREVAACMDISVNMVEKHLRRAVEYCQNKLKKAQI